MIDIHCHILPMQDDGPQSVAESVEMLRMAAAAGTTDVVATPHENPRFSFTVADVDQKIKDLQQEVGDSIRIHRGCELHLTPENIEAAIVDPDRYSINQTEYLLVEFSDFLIPSRMSDIFARMLKAGLRPIVAHPERNPLLRTRLNDLELWVRQGCLLQVTAQSFHGRYGKAAKRSSEELMRGGMVHFVASDAHDTEHRPPGMNEVFLDIEREYGHEIAHAIFGENPRAALEGTELPYDILPVASKKRRWHAIFSA